jgi:dienelactone hydrolase
VFHVPEGDGPFPVVVLSHGWIATPEIYEPVVTELARNGYLAVAPAYPLSNGLAPGGPTISDVTNQPADASFVLDQVIGASADPESWLYGLADTEHIAAGGHSLGAFTTMGFFNSCCADDRIDAAFPVAGSMPDYEGTWFGGIDTPILVIHGDRDELVPYSRSEQIYAEANSPKYFLTLLGGTHADFATAPGTQQWDISVDAILAFLDGYLRADADALDELAEIGNVDGVSTLVAS